MHDLWAFNEALPLFVVMWLSFVAVGTTTFLYRLSATKSTYSHKSLIAQLFPAEGWSSKSARIDIIIYILSKLSTKFVNILPVLLGMFVGRGVISVLNHSFPGFAPLNIGPISIVLLAVSLFLIGDFANFISHLLQHAVPFLWELHKVHHSATFLSPITTKRMHPLGDLFDGLVAAVLLGLPIGLAMFVYNLNYEENLILLANANLIGTVVVLDALRHSHFPISYGRWDRVVLSPRMHQLHHSCKLEHWDKNFGNKLSVWDAIFRTYYKPGLNEEIVLGLGSPENSHYDSLFGAYIGPCIKIWKMCITKGYGLDTSDSGESFVKRVIWRKLSNVTAATSMLIS